MFGHEFARRKHYGGDDLCLIRIDSGKQIDGLVEKLAPLTDNRRIPLANTRKVRLNSDPEHLAAAFFLQ